jgi:GntR family transcriptional regulator of arabinose operon
MTDDPDAPKYEQVKLSLRDIIQTQRLKPGDQIMSLAEIMAQYNVSKVTAVRALVELEAEGFVTREQGRGTFVSNPAGRRTANATSAAVAVVLPTFTNPFYAELLAGIESTLSRAGITAEVASTDFDVDREYEILARIVRERRCTGAIIAPWINSEHRLEEFLDQLPLIFVDYCPPAILSHSRLVRGDNYRGAYEAARHLIEFGHRRIGMVRWKFADHDRFEGFCAALREHSIDDDPPSMLLTGSQLPIPDLLNFVRTHRITGLIVVNDMFAIQALHALRHNGFRVPDDISIIGYDDIEAAQYLDVPLTTISQHDHEIGRRAGQWMVEILRQESATSRVAKEILFTPSLIVRGSSGPPPAPAISGSGIQEKPSTRKLKPTKKTAKPL